MLTYLTICNILIMIITIKKNTMSIQIQTEPIIEEIKGTTMKFITILTWIIPFFLFLTVSDMTTPGKAFTIYGVSQIIALALWAMAEQKDHEAWLNRREIEYQIWARESERRFGGKRPEKSEDFYDDVPSHNVFKFMMKG